MQNKQIHRDGKLMSGFQGAGGGVAGREEVDGCLVGMGFLSEWWKCAGIRQWGQLYNTVNALKNTDLYTLKRLNFMLCEKNTSLWI